MILDLTETEVIFESAASSDTIYFQINIYQLIFSAVS